VDLPHRCFRDLDNLVYRCMNHSCKVGACCTEDSACKQCFPKPSCAEAYIDPRSNRYLDMTLIVS